VDEGDTAAGLGGLIAGAAAEGAALGLARARGPDGDAWATLVSRPKIALAPFLRERALGELFEPPITDPGAFTDLATRAISPSLGVRFTPFALDEPGEWVVEIEGRPAAGGPRALLAAFPLYVGESTPEDGPLLVATPVRLDDPEAEALALLDDLRGLEDAPALTADPTLAASARAGVRLRTRDDETADPDPAARMRALGFTGRGAELACQAPTLSACLDSLWWSIDDRRHLLDPGLTLAGVAVETGPPLTLVVNLSVP
jgi:hypothetical protein